ncbi:MAG TPA: bis(5'-nucleosyl)-tetraphosphatase (symmetrical) YqeK [Symbiobacteriaceae bacterium]|nr:bis(5'-nucleosyl)-tetraphosphatase (symmetrical) YqeK [Symbiobacteriaceae bacterium]
MHRKIQAFLIQHGCAGVAEHTARVALRARQLAAAHGADPDAAEVAGWLHDIGNVIPDAERVAAALAYGIPVLPEEAACPTILHQKLSARLARRYYGITDEAVLAAAGCHTTLRPGAALLDKVVFLADKLDWAGPHREAVTAALQNSIDAAILTWIQRQRFQVIHPWLRAATEELTREV